MTIRTVETLEDPFLQPYRTLRRPSEHQREGIFVAEGEKVVRRLLESTLDVVSLLLTPEWLKVYQSALEVRVGNVQIFVAPKPIVESIVGFHLHQGIMAVAHIPKPASFAEALERSQYPRLLVAVEGLTNAENLGVLVRNCAAFDVDALLVGETSSSPYLRRAVRNSMGTVFRLPVVQLSDLVGAIHELRSARGIHVIAAHPHTDKKTLHQAAFDGDCCIVFGSEGEGVSADVLAACDESVAIPMKDGVDSLNVASASAVFLYETQRQRKGSHLGGGGR
ncbi:MAG: RNA methyltransferase [Ignavibacteriales bacterium]|nr:RNA methyltransferase [Ignavibacteriales bacterium]